MLPKILKSNFFQGRLFAFCGEISNRVISDSDLESYALMEIVNGQIIFATLNGQVKVYNVERQGMNNMPVHTYDWKKN